VERLVGDRALRPPVHTWLVNGSIEGIVFLHLQPAARGRSRPVPIRIERLGLGLEDPDAFLRDLGVPQS
jgi:hypothetical protein